MAIPKILHTCRFGNGANNELVEKCLRSHKKTMPDYQFIEWNETTTQLDEYPFLIRAYESKNYAHVSDMVRLLALYRHGGIYLDTDVETFQSFDPLLHVDFVCGYIWDCMLGTAVLGAAPKHPIVQALLDTYILSQDDVNFNLPNNHFITRLFIDEVDGFSLTGREWTKNGIHVLDRFAFEQPSFGLRKNYSVHHATASWRSQSAATRNTKMLVKKIMGLYLYRRFNCWVSLRRSGFRAEHEKAVLSQRR